MTLSWVNARSHSPSTINNCARKMRGRGSAGLRRTSTCSPSRQADSSPARNCSSAADREPAIAQLLVLDVLGDVPGEVGVFALGALIALRPVLALDLHEVDGKGLRRHIGPAGGVRDLVVGNQQAFEVEGQVIERILAG